MTRIHVMVGFMGFGKSTLAKQMAIDINAIILNHDEIMHTLFGRQMEHKQFVYYKDKVFDLIWILAKKIIQTGTDVIIDAGNWTSQSRTDTLEKGLKIADDVIFYQLDCPIDIAKQRVLNRTQNNKEELFIDENCFNMLLSQYKPISKEENLNVIYHKGY